MAAATDGNAAHQFGASSVGSVPAGCAGPWTAAGVGDREMRLVSVT